ncbi:hemin transporter, partial [Kitasatospora sp. NPDC059817]
RGPRPQTPPASRAHPPPHPPTLPTPPPTVFTARPLGDWPAERTGLVDLSTVDVPAGTTAYLCGPLPFLRAVREQLLTAGVPAADIHYEVFGPDLWLA